MVSKEELDQLLKIAKELKILNKQMNEFLKTTITGLEDIRRREKQDVSPEKKKELLTPYKVI
jgi:hypothetical protein